MIEQNLPYISVIITAYKRKDYLLDAINSVINQTLDKKYYEIIVIKNYNDSKIDDFINKNNIINIFSSDNSLSGKIYNGIKIANGDIISFLEDDDLFLSIKLKEIYDNFINTPNLVYYHNNFIKTNNRLCGIDYSQHRTNKKIFLKLNELNNIKTINYLISKKMIALNMSAITLRKSYFNDCLDVLQNIEMASDMFFFFYLSGKSDSSKEILICDKPLSIWFIHNSASNISNDLGIKEFKNKNLTYTKAYLNSIKYIFNELCVKNNLYTSFDNKQSLCNYLKITIAGYKSQLYLINGENININDIKLFLKLAMMRRNINLLGAFILLILGKSISKKLSIKIFLYISYRLMTI